MSSAALITRICEINAQLAALLPATQSALAGDSTFTVDELRGSIDEGQKLLILDVRPKEARMQDGIILWAPCLRIPRTLIRW